jgi:hypothetical protein
MESGQSSSVVGFGVSSVEVPGSTIRELVTLLTLTHYPDWNFSFMTELITFIPFY